MRSFCKLGVLAAALAAPGISAAATDCRQVAMRGDWRVTALTETGHTLSCDLAVTRGGAVSGNCYVIVDLDNPPPRPTAVSADGSLTLDASCALTGALQMGAEGQVLTLILEGRTWASGDTQPMFAMASGSYERAGMPLFLRVNIQRMVAGMPPVPTLS